MFEEADVEQMPIIMMIALLRYTYISRHWIPSWKNFLYRCKVELITMRDETRNVDELFQGLDRESNDTSN